MLVIGLTGGIGCGKSTVSDMFHRDFNTPIIDADAIARDLSQTPKITDLIYKELGANYFDDNRELQRDKLRLAIFSDPNIRYKLEKILHPVVYEKIGQKLNSIDAEYCIVVIPLLLETKRTELVDRILVVDCKIETQIQRVTQRDQCSRTHVNAIISTQIGRSERLKLADDVIGNCGDIESLNRKITLLHAKYHAMASSPNNCK